MATWWHKSRYTLRVPYARVVDDSHEDTMSCAVCSLQVHLLMCWAYCNDNVKAAARHVITLLTTLLRDESVSSHCQLCSLPRGVAPTRSLSLDLPSATLSFRFSHTRGPGLANWAHYAVTSTLSTNSLRRRCCCKPTAHCNKSRDPVDLRAKLRLRRKLLRPALQCLTN